MGTLAEAILLLQELERQAKVEYKTGICFQCGQKFRQTIWDCNDIEYPVECQSCSTLNDDFCLVTF